MEIWVVQFCSKNAVILDLKVQLVFCVFAALPLPPRYQKLTNVTDGYQLQLSVTHLSTTLHIVTNRF